MKFCKTCQFFENPTMSEKLGLKVGQCPMILVTLKKMFNSYLAYKQGSLTVIETFGCTEHREE